MKKISNTFVFSQLNIAHRIYTNEHENSDTRSWPVKCRAIINYSLYFTADSCKVRKKYLVMKTVTSFPTLTTRNRVIRKKVTRGFKSRNKRILLRLLLTINLLHSEQETHGERQDK